MEDRQIQVLIEQAYVQRRLGNHRQAIEHLQSALALDPDHVRAHASLALALLDARRLAGAQIEMQAALHLDGNEPFVHYVAAAVLRAALKLDDAWAHILIALDDPSADAATRVLGAQIRVLQGDEPRARELLSEALGIEAAHTGALVALARIELHAGNYADATEHIALALKTTPEDRDAHTVAGFIDLARGDVASAEGHARFVLNTDGNDVGGLELWTAVKARRSWLLGTWWRLNTWLTKGEDSRKIALMIGMFIAVRVVVIVTDELGYEAFSNLLSLAWLALCAYTWFAPALFRSWLKKELGTVKLDPEF